MGLLELGFTYIGEAKSLQASEGKHKMRLTDEEIQTIEEAIYGLDQNAAIYLFGSRVDDSQKGGDIDLLIISRNLTFSDKIKIKKKIFERIDEQKIDLIIAKDNSDPFVRLALEQGVRLE